MFESFFSSFRLDYLQTPPQRWSPSSLNATGFSDLMGRAAGGRFERGLYRLHTAESAGRADALVRDAFPEFIERAHCFGFDWLGRQFALDAARRRSMEPLVLMLEPGTGEALEVPATFASFHDEELVTFREAALANEFFDEWAASNSQSLPLGNEECLGYRVPLFLGGGDTVENLELIPIDVYWTICGQLRLGLRQLPEDATIAEIAIRGGSL